jgi:galactose mutarotase-like enzyme
VDQVEVGDHTCECATVAQWGEVAVEPVTAPANAFNTGVGLIRLEPDTPWTGRMGVYIV